RPGPSEANLSPKDILTVLGLLSVIALAIGLFGAPRISLLALCVLGALTGIVWPWPRSSWRGLAAFLVGGLLAAAGVFVVVPGAWDEWSLLTGYQESERQAESLRLLSPHDLAEFQRGRGDRQVLAGQYPQLLAPRLRQAEEEWLGRACTALAEKFDAL